MKIDGLGGGLWPVQRRDTGWTSNEPDFAGSYTDSLNKGTKEPDSAAGAEDSGGLNAASSILVMNVGRVSPPAAVECAVEALAYVKCDFVKACVTEGYVLKARVDASRQRVYVEMKREDGSIKGFEVEPSAVSQNTEEPVERMALEAWNMAVPPNREGDEREGREPQKDIDTPAGRMRSDPAMNAVYERILEKADSWGAFDSRERGQTNTRTAGWRS